MNSVLRRVALITLVTLGIGQWLSLENTALGQTGNDKEATPIGNHRIWKNAAGELVATGKFRRGAANRIVIVSRGKVAAETAIGDLSPADQNYIRLIEAGAILDPSLDQSAVPEGNSGQPQDQPDPPGQQPPAQADPNMPPGLSAAINKFREPTGSTEPSPDQEPELLGNLRRWRDSSGQILATGKFRRRTDPAKLAIVNEEGGVQEIEYGSLSNDDRIYVQAVEAGARIDIAADSAALKREIPADKLRTWKTAGGLPMGTGEFVGLKNGTVIILQADQHTRDLPLDLLCDADRQYAQAMASGDGPAKAPKGTVAIGSDTALIMPSLDSRTLLLVDHDQLKVLSSDGKTVVATHPLPANTNKLVERSEYYVAVAGNSLILLDKESLEVIGNHELWKFQRIHDVALHPKRKVAFLSVENAVEKIRDNGDERHRVILVDENNGKVKMLGDVYAKWVLVDPSGDYLLTGYKDVQTRTGGIHINPDGNIIETPRWDNTDTLRRYRIMESEIDLDEELPNAGANGQGLVMSTSGKQIAYLSFTGYPTLSYNIAVFALRDFEQTPITLATKDIADCKQLAIHPTLPLAASPGGEAVVFFDARSGKSLAKQPDLPEELKQCAVHQLVFSGDGQHLILQASKGGGERFVAAVKVPNAPVRSLAESGTENSDDSAEFKRVWTDKSGKYRVEAEFVGMKGDNVLLKKDDGTVVEVLLSKLASKDQVIARRLAARF